MHHAIKGAVAIGAGLVLALGISACTPVNPVADPSPSSSQASPTSSSTQSSSAVSTSSSTGAQTGGAAAPTDVTAPGSKLKFGQKATISATSSKDPSDPKYFSATLSMTVTKVVAGSPDDLKALKDSAKYAGQTPYYVFVDLEVLTVSGISLGMSSSPSIDATLKDGSSATKLIVFGTMGTCDSTSFKTSGKGDALTIPAGAKATACSVFLAPGGDAVTGVTYQDSMHSYAKYSDNKYTKNPLSWS